MSKYYFNFTKINEFRQLSCSQRAKVLFLRRYNVPIRVIAYICQIHPSSVQTHLNTVYNLSKKSQLALNWLIGHQEEFLVEELKA